MQHPQAPSQADVAHVADVAPRRGGAANGQADGYWLAGDGLWRSFQSDPPHWPGEVKDVSDVVVDCDLHPGAHKVAQRVAGFVYLSCGCHHLEGKVDFSEPAA